jgi:ribosome maturation factor RimP
VVRYTFTVMNLHHLHLAGLPTNLTVEKIDRTEYHGHVQATEPEEFSIREVDFKTTVTIPYDQVEQVRKNYDGKGVATQFR